eukprot:scpid66238/ scgid11978/ 
MQVEAGAGGTCIRIGTKARALPRTKDRGADRFWSVMAETTTACQIKAKNPKWGKRKISAEIKATTSLIVTESQVQRYCDTYLFDLEEDALFYKSTELNEKHRLCVSRERLVELLQKEHQRDHRHAETCYGTLRCHYYPVVRENIIALYKEHVKCTACERQAPLPKTSLVRRSILATYPNSRWQMDLKKLPSVRGFEYVCNIADCYSRFAMGAGIKSKSAKDVCAVVLKCIYAYGPPRILQTDNGREFNNASLSQVI